MSAMPSVQFLGSPKCFMGMSLVTCRPEATKNGRTMISSNPSSTISSAVSLMDGMENSLNPT